jgi:hypothetical protein
LTEIESSVAGTTTLDRECHHSMYIDHINVFVIKLKII